jgi:Domain of unknown function DUF83
MPHIDFYHNGERFPSVSEVLALRPKPWLEKWKEKWGVLAARKTVYASRIGTDFHDGAEKLSKHEDVAYPSNRRLGTMLERIEGWIKAEGFEPVRTEYHVVSFVHRYHGTLDAVGTLARYGGTPVIIDYKSSSAIYDDMAEQLAAYAEAYFEATGIRIKRGLIVHVSKDKPHHTLTVKEYRLGKRLFNRFLKKLEEYKDAEAAKSEATGC